MSPARSLTRCAGGCAAGAALGGCLAAERGVWSVLVVEATPSLKPAWELGGLEARGRPELLESGALGPLDLAVQVRGTGPVGAPTRMWSSWRRRQHLRVPAMANRTFP